MIHSKYHNSGMSFLELMGALALFTLFGSSLFVSQQYIFDRLSLAQRKVSAILRMQEELVIYHKNILKELFANQGMAEKSLQPKNKNFIAPPMTISITATSADIKENEKQEKSNAQRFKNIHLITVKAQESEKKESTVYGTMYMMLFIPQVKK